MEQALSDVKVLDLTHYIAGPYCTKLLADYGADVVKIERPGTGDPARRMGPFPNDEPHSEKSGLFLHLNTNKRGITLNLKTEMGKQILKQLVKDVDILVENFSPRVMQGLGLDYDALQKINPKLVMTSISNFGQTGPYRDYKASEIILYGMGSEMYCTGVADREPVMLGPNITQYMAAGAASVATMGAFYAARYQSIGNHVDMAIVEATSGGTERRSTNLLAYQYTGETNPRMLAIDVGYPLGTYPCRDGYTNIMGGLQYWDRVVKMLGSPEALKDPKWKAPTAQSNPELMEEFNAIYYPWLMEHTKKECVEIAQAAGAPCTPVQTMEDVVNDPHFNTRDFFTEIDHPATGKLKYPGRPVIMSQTPWQVARPSPMLGQHNGEVYGEIGYTAEDLVKLRQQGII